MQLGKDKVDTGDAMASSLQSRNRLGKRRGEDDALPTPICGKRKQEGKEKKVRKTEKDEDEEVLRKLVPRRF